MSAPAGAVPESVALEADRAVDQHDETGELVFGCVAVQLRRPGASVRESRQWGSDGQRVDVRPARNFSSLEDLVPVREAELTVRLAPRRQRAVGTLQSLSRRCPH